MDLNELFHRHQVSVVRAAGSACTETRRAQADLAGGYAVRIAEFQDERGATAPMTGDGS